LVTWASPISRALTFANTLFHIPLVFGIGLLSSIAVVTNGDSWTLVGCTTVTMATNYHIGLAVSCGSNTTPNTSPLSNVSVTP